MTIVEEIEQLKKAANAVILAHNYCRPEVQDVADITGDSLELARKATAVTADVIVLCGVYFMAETAKILNPSKTVLIPDASAGCPMADTITGEELRKLKARHPDALAVCYVNSTAEVKAECDLCVTSGNAERVMATVPANREVLFVPDKNLGRHIADKFGRDYELWAGCCPIHDALTVDDVKAARQMTKDEGGVPVLVHPECAAPVRAMADQCLSTGGMCAFARQSAVQTIIVGTEVGILHRLRKENPDKHFIPVGHPCCSDMKKATLENVAACLRNRSPEVVVPSAVAERARRAIDAMLALS